MKDTEQRYVFSSHYWEQIDLGEDGDIYGKTDREIKIATLRKYLPEEYIEEIEEQTIWVSWFTWLAQYDAVGLQIHTE